MKSVLVLKCTLTILLLVIDAEGEHESSPTSNWSQSGQLNRTDTIYLIPSYTFNCSGKVIQWEICVSQVDRNNDSLEMGFNVYRPTPASECYSFVGMNVFRWHTISENCITFYVDKNSQIEVSQGDVVAFYTSNLQVGTSSALTLEGSTNTTVWYAISSLTTVDPECILKTGSLGNLSPANVNLPELKAVTEISRRMPTSTCIAGIPHLPNGSWNSVVSKTVFITVISTQTCLSSNSVSATESILATNTPTPANCTLPAFWTVLLTLIIVVMVLVCISGTAIFLMNCKVLKYYQRDVREHTPQQVVLLQEDHSTESFRISNRSRPSTTNAEASIMTTRHNTAYGSSETCPSAIADPLYEEAGPGRSY